MSWEGEFAIATESRSADDGSIAFVRVSGEVDLANTDQVAAALRSPGTQRVTRVVLDLTGVSFMDSSGLATLLQAKRDLGQGLAVVIAKDSALANTFAITGVDGPLQVEFTESAAVSSLNAPGPDGA